MRCTIYVLACDSMHMPNVVNALKAVEDERIEAPIIRTRL
jgi:hypothetical protein